MQKVDTTTASPAMRVSAARLSISAAAAVIVLLAALHVLSPEFNPEWRMVSEYSLGAFGGVLSLMFLAWALSGLSLFFAIKSHIRTTGGRIGMGFLVAAVVGQTMAAFFGIPHPLHGLAFMIGMPSFLIAATLITRSLLRTPAGRAARRPLLWTVSLSWVSFVLLLLTLFVGLSLSGGEFGPGAPIGWPNRLLVIACCAWTMVAAWSTTRIDR